MIMITVSSFFTRAFDHAQLLNPQQHQRRPDLIEKLHRHEQNPQLNFVSFRSEREGNAVMSDKHFHLVAGAFVPNGNARRFTETPYRNCFIIVDRN
jgi:hypothetical protein